MCIFPAMAQRFHMHRRMEWHSWSFDLHAECQFEPTPPPIREDLFDGLDELVSERMFP